LNKRTKRAPAKKTKRTRRSADSGYHFIAYVPVNGFVWELDGLRARPAKLGTGYTGIKHSSNPMVYQGR
jgi:ubiquitin carboxyl-terminal hydrolase L5